MCGNHTNENLHVAETLHTERRGIPGSDLGLQSSQDFVPGPCPGLTQTPRRSLQDQGAPEGISASHRNMQLLGKLCASQVQIWPSALLISTQISISDRLGHSGLIIISSYDLR